MKKCIEDLYGGEMVVVAVSISMLCTVIYLTETHGEEYARFVFAMWNMGNAIVLTQPLY